jgi:hypothetical protein
MRTALTHEPRLLFGFAILIVTAVLAVIIAVGKVQQDTSYGLQIVLGSLATLAGAFAQWAFSQQPPNDPPDRSGSGPDQKEMKP